jgi:hypothetical protein
MNEKKFFHKRQPTREELRRNLVPSLRNCITIKIQTDKRIYQITELKGLSGEI